LSEEQVPAFRELTGLVKWLKIALAVLAAATVLTALLDWQQINSPQRTQTPDEEFAKALKELFVVGTWGITNLVTGILFLRWTYLTKKNASALGASGFAASPGWSVGYYFVPILSLWKSYQALKETFQASDPEFRGDWQSAPRPRLLPLWWTLWLVSNLAAQASLRTSLQADTANDNTARLDLISSLLDLPLIAVVWVLISTLQAWQTTKALAKDSGSREPKAGVDLTRPPESPAPIP